MSAPPAHWIIAESHAGKAVLVHDYGYPEARTVVVHNGLDAEAFEENARAAMPVRQELGLAADRAVIVTAARLAREKGHRYLLAAMPAIHDRFPDVCLLIAGDGPLRGDLERLVETIGLVQSVRFLGWRHDMPGVLAAADLVVLPSLWEPFGLVLLEAMALRKPVVGSAVGGIPEVVVDGETGYLVPPADHAALSAKVVQLLSSPEARNAMGRAGRQRVEKHFSLSARTSGTYALWSR